MVLRPRVFLAKDAVALHTSRSSDLLWIAIMALTSSLHMDIDKENMLQLFHKLQSIHKFTQHLIRFFYLS